MRLSVIVDTLLSEAAFVLNSRALGIFHSVNHNQCIGGLGRFLSSELNKGSVGLNTPTTAVQLAKVEKNPKV